MSLYCSWLKPFYLLKSKMSLCSFSLCDGQGTCDIIDVPFKKENTVDWVHVLFLWLFCNVSPFWMSPRCLCFSPSPNWSIIIIVWCIADIHSHTLTQTSPLFILLRRQTVHFSRHKPPKGVIRVSGKKKLNPFLLSVCFSPASVSHTLIKEHQFHQK